MEYTDSRKTRRQTGSETDHRRRDVMNEIGHPQCDRDSHQDIRAHFAAGDGTKLCELILDIAMSVDECALLGWIEPEDRQPARRNGDQIAWQICQEPRAVINRHAAEILD